MSIGDALTEARRQAGLTVAQVSHQTGIRETIITAIEGGDYSACGGDSYARGYIRSVAQAVGADPEPLIRVYNTAQPGPLPVTDDMAQPTPQRATDTAQPTPQRPPMTRPIRSRSPARPSGSGLPGLRWCWW